MDPDAGVLLVVDDPDAESLLQLLLRERAPGVPVHPCGDPLSFARALADRHFDAVVLGVRLTWGEPAEVLRTLRRKRADCAVVLVDAGAAASRRDPPEEESPVLPATPTGLISLPAAMGRARARGRTSLEAARYRRLLDCLALPTFTLDRNGRLRTVSAGLCTLLGDTGARLQGEASLVDLIAEPRARGLCRDALERGTTLRDLSTRMRGASGDEISVLVSLWPLEEHGDNGFEGVALALRETQVRGVVQGRISEFEQLAYAISHDLQDPLQIILHTARQMRAQQDDQGKASQIDRVVDSATLMQSMLDGVLEYARVGSSGRGFTRVPLAGVIEDLRRQLAQQPEAANAQITVGQLPEVVGDRTELTQLFQNLLGNAVKFRGAEPARIRIGCESREDEWLLTVADSGIGMETRDAERVFGMFERLHTSEEYPGTGIGLAVCRRIAAHHGGRIWVESDPGEGAAFFVTLSRRLAPAPAHGASREEAGGQ